MTILFCTTEDFLLTSLEYRFRKNGWRLEIANNTEQAIEGIKTHQPDLLIVDLQLPDYQGLDIVQKSLKEISPKMPVLVGAPLSEDGMMLEGLRLGAKDFIVAPFKPDELIIRIRLLLGLKTEAKATSSVR